MAKNSKGHVIRGSLRYKRLPIPVEIAGHTATTPQKLKETAFQLFDNFTGNQYQNILFIDLYAGAGQMGIEAISRDCKNVIFCELNDARLRNIAKWLETNQLEGKCVKRDALRYLKQLELIVDGFDQICVYADPPYKDFSDTYNRLIVEIEKIKASTPCLVLIQSPVKRTKPIKTPRSLIIKEYSYSKNKLIAIEKKE